MALLECALYALVQHGTSRWWICGSFCLKVAANGRFCWTSLTCHRVNDVLQHTEHYAIHAVLEAWVWHAAPSNPLRLPICAILEVCTVCVVLRGRQWRAHCLVIKDLLAEASKANCFERYPTLYCALRVFVIHSRPGRPVVAPAYCIVEGSSVCANVADGS